MGHADLAAIRPGAALGGAASAFHFAAIRHLLAAATDEAGLIIHKGAGKDFLERGAQACQQEKPHRHHLPQQEITK